MHSEYSLLDGACRIEGMVSRAKELGQSALAITDHGVMYGVVDFYRAAKKAGIKPIIGCEVYVASRGRTDKVYELDAESHHLVLLCKNETGYRNLSKMVSLGFTEGFYVRPRVDYELLQRYSEGLICMSACLSGEIPKKIIRDDFDGAKETALKYLSIFGEGNYYLEVQDHRIPSQRQVNAGIFRLHEETGIPVVATNDAHYTLKEDARLQDILMCIQTGKTVDEPDRMKFQTEEFYLKSEEEMSALFSGYPEVIENTVKIAELCNFDFKFGEYHLPKFELPEGEKDAAAYLRKVCLKGFEERYPDNPEGYTERLDYELETIESMGFVDYFLIVSDFIGFARSNGIPVGPGRGSGAGSMAAYCLRITDIDPIKYSLYFERFLNPDRISMPDFDIDFCPNRRQEVIDYVIDKYGSDHVAQIVTFGTMAARGAIRDVARVLNVSYAEADTVAKLVPMQLGMNIETALKLSKPLREMYDGDERIKTLIDTAQALEGMPRHTSTHAAGVVITQNPVSDYVPLSKNDELIVTQFPMGTIEELGLLKMDFLGLRNLTVIDDCNKAVQAAEPEFDIYKVQDGDRETYEMLAGGDTLGVFQLESAGMTNVAVGLIPQSVEDITAIVSLYRPGPMDSIPKYIEGKHHPEKVKYKHPLLKDILEVTYGCIIYQEQVMEVFRKLAGYSLGRADIVRRAMSKKKMDVLKSERENFICGSEKEGIPGCGANGVSEETANSLFDEILDFANYAFNKAHAAAYAMVAYQTAYLKRHYPKEFMAALLTSVLDSTGKVTEYISECKRMGIEVLPPDINESNDGFTAVGGNIRFGLVAVKNIGRKFITEVMAERERDGRFKSFQSFCERMFSRDLNRRAVESLIKCGAFDSMGGRRSQLLAVSGSLLDNISSSQGKVMSGQIDMFSLGGEDAGEELPLPDIPEFPKKELVKMEKEVVGMYLSGHPMEDFIPMLRRSGAVSINKLLASFEEENGKFKDDQAITIAGIVAKLRMKSTKRGEMMAYAEIEDEGGVIEAIVFPRTLDRSGLYLKENEPIIIKGRVSLREDRDPQIVCDTINSLNMPQDIAQNEKELENSKKTLYLRLKSENTSETVKIKPMLNMFPGKSRVVLYFEDTQKRISCFAEIDKRLVSRLYELIGEENVKVK
jgi:DNA polymerase-3 subunit alpha